MAASASSAVTTNLPTYVELKLDKRMYCPGDLVTGAVTVVTCKPNKRFDSIRVNLEGKTDLEVSPRDVGLFDAFYSPPEPVLWIRRTSEVAKNGTFTLGRNTFFFELALAPTTSRELVETLKGLCIRTTYVVSVSVSRGFSSRSLSTECELYVQVPSNSNNLRKPPSSSPPNQFRFSDIIAGEVQSMSTLGTPVSGHVIVSSNAQNARFSSVDVEILRVEDVSWGEDTIREICAIHTSQIIDGTLPVDTLVPFFFIVPRLVVSPSYVCDEYQVSYFFNVLLTIKGGAGEEEVLTRTVPLTFIR